MRKLAFAHPCINDETYSNLPCARSLLSIPTNQCTSFCLPFGASQEQLWILRVVCLCTHVNVDHEKRGFTFPTTVHAVQVVQVWREAESLDAPIDVGLDVRGFVCDSTVFENSYTALGCDFRYQQSAYAIMILRAIRKILSRQLCFLMKSPKIFSLRPAA